MRERSRTSTVVAASVPVVVAVVVFAFGGGTGLARRAGESSDPKATAGRTDTRTAFAPTF